VLTIQQQRRLPPVATQRGVGLIEVLITIVITSFGLIGLVALAGRMTVGEMESLQRTHALTLLASMTQRMQANVSAAGTYLGTTPLGTADSQPADCASLTSPTMAQQDACEWSNALKGAAEKSGGNAVGAMLGARGCIEQLLAEDVAICQPATYRITVAWQGLSATTAPSLSCGTNLYGVNDAVRRTVSAQVTKPLFGC
jgi:type IV pilus assembly protein PilV